MPLGENKASMIHLTAQRPIDLVNRMVFPLLRLSSDRKTKLPPGTCNWRVCRPVREDALSSDDRGIVCVVQRKKSTCSALPRWMSHPDKVRTKHAVLEDAEDRERDTLP
jgi:hypothetical protein